MSGDRDRKGGLLDLDDPTELEASAPARAPGEPGQPARPTARPQFDPNEILEDAEFRERMPTITADEELLEQARVASMPSQHPAPAPPKVAAGPLMLPKEPPPPLDEAPPGAPPMRPRMPSVEIMTGEEDLDQLGGDEQIAILRARLAPLSRVPQLARSLAELGALLEDPKTAYVLGFVDGVLPLDTIIDVTGLPELDTLRVLDKVASQGLFVYGKNAR